MLPAAEWRSGGEVEQGPANASQLRRCAELFVVGAAARGSCAASREGRRESPR